MLAAALAGPVASMAPRAVLAAQSSTADYPPPGCIADPVTSQRQVDPDTGQPTSDPARAATVTTFDTPEGSVEERTPASGWQPTQATPAELTFFGLPKPTEPAAVARWTQFWSNVSGWAPPGHCHFPYQVSAATKLNWAGMEAYSDTFTTVSGHLTVNNDVACTNAASSHVGWVGLGGDPSLGSNRLLQNGINDNNGSTPYAWYEAINGSYDTHVTPVPLSMSTGDAVAISTTYYSTSPQSVSFAWHDLSNGTATLTYSFSNFGGIGVANFYDGTSAEAIDERLLVSGYYQPLSNFGVMHWSNQYAASTGVPGGQTLRQYAHHQGIDMYDKEGVWLAATSGPTGLDKTDVTWKACGHKDTAP